MEFNAAITPTQIHEMQGVFDTIVAQPWFYDTEDSRQEVSNIVMHNFRLGHVHEDDLLRVCLKISRQRLSK